MTLEELVMDAQAWAQCLICQRSSKGSQGLHRHIRGAHGLSAWEYYQQHPRALLLRALAHCRIEAMGPVAIVAGPCWLYQGAPDRWGARFRVHGAPTQALYRLTYWAAAGSFPAGYACHVCDTPSCCNPLHVWDGTPAENAADRDSKGRGHDHRLVTDAQARWAARLHHGGSSYRDIARRLGVGQETARRAVLRVVDEELAATAAELGTEVPW